MTGTQVSTFKDGVIVRSHNRRIVIRKNKRVVNAAVIEIYSVNKDRGLVNAKGHVYSDERLRRRATCFPISYEALREIGLAIEVYSAHVEPISEDSVIYKN